MSDDPKRCPKCGSEMAEGFLLELGHANASAVTHWIGGNPIQKKFLGMNTGVKMPDASEIIPVGVFRCTSCGFLEAYAQHEFAVKKE